MSRKPYKSHKRSSKQRFLMLYDWMTESPAWLSLSPTARSLYFEIKKRFNGSNNGRITLSHREAAQRLCVNRNTVGRYFKELEERGFIRAAQRHHLGPNGIGQTTLWILEELELNGQPATKAFMNAAKQKPRCKNRTQRAKKRDTTIALEGPYCPAVIEFGTYLKPMRQRASQCS